MSSYDEYDEDYETSSRNTSVSNSNRETPPDARSTSFGRMASKDRPRKAHYASVSESIDEATIQQGCAMLLKNIHTPFKGFGNKLKRICSDLTSTCDRERLDSIRNAIENVYHTRDVRLQTPPENIFSYLTKNDLYEMDDEFGDLVDKSYIWKGRLSSYNIKLWGQKGVGEGVTRTALQMMLDEIADDQFFVPAEQGSTRYVLNPEVTMEYLNSIGYAVNIDDEVAFVYRQIGGLMALCTRYDIPIPFNLSRGILANILYRQSEIEADEYVMYYLLDMPQMASSLVSMLQHPSSIKEALSEAHFNDYYKLVKKKDNKTITAENFKEYIRLLAKHQLTQQHEVGANSTYSNLRAFLDGFYIRTKLRKMNVTVGELDRLMHGQPISENAIRDWLIKGRIVSNYDNAQHRNTLKWLKQIISSGGKDFPLDLVGDKSNDKKTEFLNFIGKLMYFWTGVRKLDTSKQYQVILMDTVLPKASTCFYQLKLPYNVQSKEELYRKLIMAVYNVEQGVGLYGGKKKHKRK